MLNHFRTLLLNLSYAGDRAEHIPKDFSGIILPQVFNEIYDSLFPKSTSRYYKLFLAQNYIRIIQAAGLTPLFELDNRISYSDSGDFFKIHRNSKPNISNIDIPIFVYGDYIANNSNLSYYDNYLISQVSNTTNILVYSTIRKVYISGDLEFDTPDVEAEITLNFVNGVSTPILIGNSGISFSVGGGAVFSSTSNKTWEFLVEAPFVFSLNRVIDNLQSNDINTVLAAKATIDTTKYDNLWKQHYNPVYKLAGLLLGYVARIDNLWKVM